MLALHFLELSCLGQIDHRLCIRLALGVVRCFKVTCAGLLVRLLVTRMVGCFVVGIVRKMVDRIEVCVGAVNRRFERQRRLLGQRLSSLVIVGNLAHTASSDADLVPLRCR